MSALRFLQDLNASIVFEPHIRSYYSEYFAYNLKINYQCSHIVMESSLSITEFSLATLRCIFMLLLIFCELSCEGNCLLT